MPWTGPITPLLEWIHCKQTQTRMLFPWSEFWGEVMENVDEMTNLASIRPSCCIKSKRIFQFIRGPRVSQVAMDDSYNVGFIHFNRFSEFHQRPISIIFFEFPTNIVYQ